MIEVAEIVSAEHLVESHACVDGTIRIKDLVLWFKDNPEQDYVGVVEEGVVAGLAGRDELSRSMMGQFGYSLMANRLVREEMIREVVVVEGSLDLAGVVRRLVRSGLKGRAFYQDLIIVTGGRFLGLASVKRLLVEEVLENLSRAGRLAGNSEYRPAAPPPRDGETISGRLQDLPVMDLAQMLALGGKKGELRIEGADHEGGCIFFSAGRIVHASAGRATGTDALKSLLGLERGTFRFFQGIATAQVTIDMPATMALLDAGRAMDEERIAGVA